MLTGFKSFNRLTDWDALMIDECNKIHIIFIAKIIRLDQRWVLREGNFRDNKNLAVNDPWHFLAFLFVSSLSQETKPMKHIIHGALASFVGSIPFKKQLLLLLWYEGSGADQFWHIRKVSREGKASTAIDSSRSCCQWYLNGNLIAGLMLEPL